MGFELECDFSSPSDPAASMGRVLHVKEMRYPQSPIEVCNESSC